MARHDLPGGNRTLNSLALSCGACRLLCFLAITALPAVAHAGWAIVSWDPSPAATTAGYKIHNAPSGQAFTSPIDVGNVTYYTLTGLDSGIAYQLAISAYDVFGQESPLSAVVVYNPKQDGDSGGDLDGDGLPDSLELAGCTSPNDADSDDDGLADGSEDLNGNGVHDAAETSACAADTDGDGLQDGTELGTTAALVGPATDPGVFRPDLNPATATDPLNADTDGDGLPDGSEDLNANGRVDVGETDPLVADTTLLFADTFADGTKYGDPSWKQLRGAWSVIGAARRYSSTSAPVSLALIADPGLKNLNSGRIESSLFLTRTYVKTPEARIVFHYQDAGHYRYVRLSGTGVSIGQVGSNPVEQAGVKASLRRRARLNAHYRLRLDIQNGKDVKVYLNDNETPLLTYSFAVSSSGRVGYLTQGARSLFDDTAVWSELVLQ